MLSKETKTLLVNTLVMPKIDYASPVFINIHSALNYKIQKLQNSCIRFILNVKRREHISPYLQELNWLNVKNRRTFLALSLLYRILNNKEPRYLYDQIAPYRKKGKQINLRQKTHFTIPVHRTTFYGNCFIVTAIKEWNDLPHH